MKKIFQGVSNTRESKFVEKHMACLISLACAGLGMVIAPMQAQSQAALAAQEVQGLKEIVVTAQRRNENLQNAALPVSALTSDQIDGKVTSAQDLTQLVPAVTFSTGGGASTQVTLRGIGALTGNALAEQVVAFNLDGVYLARSGGSNGLFYDLDRIEVLKGPQGTLYGRNATAGAVNLITKKPTQQFGGDVSVQFGNYGLKQGQGAINVPISDTVALRVAGQSINRRGYLTDGYDDQKQYSGKAALLIKPNEGLSILLNADYVHIGGKGSANVLSAPYINPSNPYLGPSSPQTVAFYNTDPRNSVVRGPFTFRPAESAPTPNGFNDNNITGLSATIDWELGGGKLTAISSYRESKFRYSGYTAGFRLDDDETSTAKSLEVRYATPESNILRGVLGAYYFKDSGHFDLFTYIYDLVPRAFGGGPDPTHVQDFDTTATAVFGQATLDLTKTFRLIAGARYSEEKKTVAGTTTIGVFPFSGDMKVNKATYKVGVETDLAPHSLAYFTVGSGFKAGGFFAASAPNTFKPEFLTAWTLGSKNRFLDNRLQLNAEAFYWDYKDKQVSHLGPINNGTGVSLVTENAGKAKLYGAEVEARYLVTPDDMVSATVQYEHTRYDSYVVISSPGRPASNCAVTPTAVPGAFKVDCTGNEVALAPKWILNLGYSHTMPLASGADLVFSVAGIIKSNYWLGEEHLRGQKQSGYGKWDLDMTYNSSDGRWSVSAYVANVTDRVVSPFTFVHPEFGQPMQALEMPRTFGVKAAFRF